MAKTKIAKKPAAKKMAKKPSARIANKTLTKADETWCEKFLEHMHGDARQKVMRYSSPITIQIEGRPWQIVPPEHGFQLVEMTKLGRLIGTLGRPSDYQSDLDLDKVEACR
jgi:hypothetical protein